MGMRKVWDDASGAHPRAPRAPALFLGSRCTARRIAAQCGGVLAFVLTGCAGPQVTVPSPTPTLEAPATAPAVTPMAEASPTTVASPGAPTATLSPWEEVQRSVQALRNLLDRESDGYAGLTIALQQDRPNPEWCNGLSAGINDFRYAGDNYSADALQLLKGDQGCP